VSDNLPNGIPEILQYLAQRARGYDNHLQWNEVAKLKADLMNARARWVGVPVSRVANYCRTLGMRAEDVTEIAALVKEAQDGHRLVPPKAYRAYRFNQPVDEPTTTSSREW
jgi:hypothetical protein